MGPPVALRAPEDNAATKKKATAGVAFFKSRVGCGDRI